MPSLAVRVMRRRMLDAASMTGATAGECARTRCAAAALPYAQALALYPSERCRSRARDNRGLAISARVAVGGGDRLAVA